MSSPTQKRKKVERALRGCAAGFGIWVQRTEPSERSDAKTGEILSVQPIYSPAPVATTHSGSLAPAQYLLVATA